MSDAAQLDTWLEEVRTCGISALRSVAMGLQADRAAVAAGLTLSYSNGRTEGNVNRLKYVKRQMYELGKLDLLRVHLMVT